MSWIFPGIIVFKNQAPLLLPTSDMEAALHTDTRAVYFPCRPEGTYGLVCLAQQVSHSNLWCSESSSEGWDSAQAPASQVVRATLISDLYDQCYQHQCEEGQNVCVNMP